MLAIATLFRHADTGREVTPSGIGRVADAGIDDERLRQLREVEAEAVVALLP